jgi:transglutaminase-like putative cysteine protease
MLLTIHHQTVYRFGRAVTLLQHRLLFVPRSGHDLRIEAMALVTTPRAEITWSDDIFGNRIATADFAAPADRLEIDIRIDVEQTAPEWPVFQIATDAHSYPFHYDRDELLDLGALLTPSGDPAVARWANAFIAGNPTDTLALLKDINAGVLGSVAYRERDEEGTQSPGETLAKASGSCRDIAALFIDAVRGLGIGARAVSGYLFDPQITAADGGSTHAWAEVYLPGAGWIAFDPTHRRVGGAYLIPAAVARSNGQIMPVTGGYLGTPADALGMTVEVRVSERPSAAT